MQDRVQPDSAAAAALDNAVLDLMLSPPRPWSEEEIKHTISLRGDICAALARLEEAGLINRWDSLACASYAATRFFGIANDGTPGDEHEHRHEFAVLELLLGTNEGRTPMSRKEILRALGVKKKSGRLDVIDAIGRLRDAGLLEHSGKMLFPSRAALRFDHIAA